MNYMKCYISRKKVRIKRKKPGNHVYATHLKATIGDDIPFNQIYFTTGEDLKDQYRTLEASGQSKNILQIPKLFSKRLPEMKSR